MGIIRENMELTVNPKLNIKSLYRRHINFAGGIKKPQSTNRLEGEKLITFQKYQREYNESNINVYH